MVTAAHAATHCVRRSALCTRAVRRCLLSYGTRCRPLTALTLYGPKPGTPRTPTLSFTLRGFSTDDVADALAERGVFVSNGDFYAATIVERLGLVPGGLVRVGCSCYTSDAEVDRLIDGVRALARERA